MRWEVRTMASGTSCFNSALYRKTLGRFWPLWTLWGVLWLLLLPLSQLSRYFDWAREGRSDSALVENFQEILSLQEVGVWLAALVGVLAAMAVFSYLYSARSACMMHALPLRREGLFLSQYLAGLTMLVLPLAAVALVTLAVGMAVVPSWGWSQALPAVGVWLACMSGVCLFFYSFACFCAMFTGQLLALPVFYAILNWLAMVVNFLVTALMEQFFYGYQANYLPAWVEFLTPVGLLRQACYWGVRDVYDDGALVRGLAAPQLVALYAGIGVVFALLALWVYRGRQVESAGDVVSVPLVRPVFKYGVALCSGLCLGVFTTQILGWYNTDSTAVLVVCVLLWTAAGYFAAEMLLKKSFRVLRAWKGCAAAMAVMVFLCAVCVFDLFGVETRVPDPDRVISMEADAGMGYPGDSGRLELVTSDREIIEQVTALHQAMVNERERAGTEAGDDYISLWVTYRLENGSTLSRQYYSVPVFRDEIDREGTLTWQADQILQDRTLTEQLYGFDKVEGWRLTEADLYDVYQVQEDFWDSIYLEQSTADLLRLWEAVRQDFREGTLGNHSLFLPEDGDSTADLWPSLQFYWEKPMEREDYQGLTTAASQERETVSIALNPRAEHTMAWLEAHGLPGEGYALFWDEET